MKTKAKNQFSWFDIIAFLWCLAAMAVIVTGIVMTMKNYSFATTEILTEIGVEMMFAYPCAILIREARKRPKQILNWIPLLFMVLSMVAFAAACAVDQHHFNSLATSILCAISLAMIGISFVVTDHVPVPKQNKAAKQPKSVSNDKG